MSENMRGHLLVVSTPDHNDGTVIMSDGGPGAIVYECSATTVDDMDLDSPPDHGIWVWTGAAKRPATIHDRYLWAGTYRPARVDDELVMLLFNMATP